MQILTLLLLAVAGYILLTLYRFVTNYLSARKSGFLVLTLPVPVSSLPWVIFSVPLRPLFSRYLAPWMFARLNMGIYGWEFLAKNDVYQRLGTQSFMLATASTPELWTSDPEVTHEILTRRKDFRMSDIGVTMMSVFGPNILVVNDESWVRQRKVIASNINERISAVVFRESCRQAQEMLGELSQTSSAAASEGTEGNGGTRETLEGLKTIAIHVLGAAGYGFSQPFHEEKVPPTPPYKLTYIEAVREVIDNLIFATMLPAKVMLWGLWPEWLRTVGTAVEEFPVHTRKTLENERKRAAEEKGGDSHANLMSMMVKMTDEAKEGTVVDKDKSSMYLTEEEIQGNLFVFTSAGFDTTANTMGYAVALLAAYPKWQQWVIEEIDEILPLNKDILELEYSEVWPKVSRILALLFETVRLFPPLVHIARWSEDPTTITTPSKTYVLPAKTTIYINSVGLHHNAEVWGKDALEFRPDRWILPSTEANEKHRFYTPPKGQFVPWSTGPRVCPGMKFSQVEFASVFMTLFRTHRVEPVLEGGETVEAAQQRLIQLMDDSISKLTLQIKHPEKCNLKWIPRKTGLQA